MVRRIFALIFLLTVGNLACCQEWENLLFITIGEVLEKQEAAMSQLKGMQEKLEHVEGKLQEIQEKQEPVEGKLQEIQEKQEHIEGKVQEIQEKLQHIESNLQDFHHELGHLKGAVNNNQDSLQGIIQENKGCLKREDLEQFKNISSSGQQELESSFHQGISGVISLLETVGIDECSEGSHNCSDHEFCTDKFVHFSCTCLSGFAQDGSRCEDIDECAQGKAECSPHATCRNSFGSYNCSCNPPFEGDGRTCEFPCESLGKFFEDVGCVKFVMKSKTFKELNDTCHQDGGRLLQDFSYESLQEVVQAFDSNNGDWVGVYEGRWLESGLPLQQELLSKVSQGSDPSRIKGVCGSLSLEGSSSYKVGHRNCSWKDWGYCQYVTPQK